MVAAAAELEVKGESDKTAVMSSRLNAREDVGGARKRLNKEDRLREKAAADAEAMQGRTLRYCVIHGPTVCYNLVCLDI